MNDLVLHFWVTQEPVCIILPEVLDIQLTIEGKTTVVRLYAKFLASVGALPGNFFVETSGSRLSNDGVNGCKKHIQDILNNGGGALFIDEAYQLVQVIIMEGRKFLIFFWQR